MPCRELAPASPWHEALPGQCPAHPVSSALGPSSGGVDPRMQPRKLDPIKPQPVQALQGWGPGLPRWSRARGGPRAAELVQPHVCPAGAGWHSSSFLPACRPHGSPGKAVAGSAGGDSPRDTQDRGSFVQALLGSGVAPGICPGLCWALPGDGERLPAESPACCSLLLRWLFSFAAAND